MEAPSPASTPAPPAAERPVATTALHGLWGALNPVRVSRALRVNRGTPIVIGGCGRSGTTLLVSMLSCRPTIFAVPEETRVLCPGAYGNAPNFGLHRGRWAMFRRLLRYPIPAACRRWCEKTPKNVLFFENILRDFDGDVRLLHIVRDGRDVVVSKHPVVNPGRYYVSPQRWVEDVTAGLRFYDHPRVLTLRYEDLVRRTEPTLRRVCAFIEEEFDPRMLHPEQSAAVRAHGALEGGRVTAVHASSIGRRHDPAHRERVAELLAYPGARELLTRLGYEDD